MILFGNPDMPRFNKLRDLQDVNSLLLQDQHGSQVIYGELKRDIGVILRKLCNEMKVEIIEAEACPDHIHMLVSIPPYMSIAQFVGTLKSKSALMQGN